jgi:hypothetical protein
MTAVLQQQYLQTELILWIRLVLAFRLKQLSAAPLQVQTMNQVSNPISKEITLWYFRVTWYRK